MKKNNLLCCCFLIFFCSSVIFTQAQNDVPEKGKTGKISKKHDFDDDDEYMGDISWKQRGFEFFIGGGIYFAGKKTANYYNGARENDINLITLFNNEYHRNDVLIALKEKYHHIDTMRLREDYNYDSRYSMSMDISLGARYRFNRNWYCELSYSYRRISCENKFCFDFPGGIDGNKENPPYSNWESLIAKEERHYIDFSIGYIFQENRIAKPFISIGAQFNYINIKSFLAIIEDKPFDLVSIARYPHYIPNVQYPINYRVWAGPGYGFSVTAGLKLVATHMVSLDPVFQLSMGSFGHSRNLPDFNTNLCFNYMVGVRLVVNSGFLSKKQP